MPRRPWHHPPGRPPALHELGAFDPPRPTRRSRVWFVLLTTVVVLAASCGGYTAADTVEIESAPVVDEEVQVLDLVEVDGVLLALASDQAGSGGLILRSADAGRTWRRSEAPAAPFRVVPAVFRGEPPSRLLVAGRWLVAVRSGLLSGSEAQLRFRQDVVVSADSGRSWIPVELPTPPGTTALVRTAVEADGQLLIGGSTQSTAAEAGPLETGFAQSLQAYDAALWSTGDPSSGLERVAAATFDGLPDNQSIDQLVDVDGRLVTATSDARGLPQQCCSPERATTVLDSIDGGVTWRPMIGVPGVGAAPTSRPPTLDGDPLTWRAEHTLVLAAGQQRYVLPAGSSGWTAEPNPVPVDASQLNEVALPDGALAITWVANVACDCSIGYAGRVEDEGVLESELDFRACSDTSVRGDSRVGEPVVVGDRILAIGSCNDHDRQAASLVVSDDGGLSWATRRLVAFAPDGADLVLGAFVVAADGALVALFHVTSLARPGTPGLTAPGPVIALRITAIN